MGIFSKIKDAVLGRNKTHQVEVDNCVEALKELAGKYQDDDYDFRRCDFFEDVRNAFASIFKGEVSKKVSEGKKKGFDGFISYVDNLFHGYNWKSWEDGYDEKMLKVLRNVKKFKAPRSRVNALISPCEKLYREYIRLSNRYVISDDIGSYFDLVSYYLYLAAGETRDSGAFFGYLRGAFSALKKVAEIESKEEGSKTVGEWYNQYVKDVKVGGEKGVLEAVLAIDDEKYQGNGGFWKWLRKGGTKMQRLSKLVKKVRKRAKWFGLNGIVDEFESLDDDEINKMIENSE